MRRLLEERFFQEVSPFPLSCFRFLFCLSLGSVFLFQCRYYLGIYGTSYYYPPPILSAVFGFQAPPYFAFAAIFWILVASLFASALGILPRFFLVLSALSYLLYTAMAFAFLYLGRRYLPPFFILLLLAFSPGVGAYTFGAKVRRRDWPESVPSWPVELTKLTVMLVYFISACSKLLEEPTHWFDGRIIQNTILESFFEGNRAPLVDTLAHGFPGRLLGVPSIIFELGFISAFFFPRLTKYFLVFAFFFHLGIAVWIRVPFLFPVFWCAFFIFLDFDSIRGLAARAFSPIGPAGNKT